MKAYDVRPAAKDEVQSLGARFVELNLESAEGSGGYARAMDEEYYRRQREALMPTLTESDVVITTAAVPGKRAPLLITREMVEVMPPGSILIDLAAEQGGNCELTHPGDMVVHHGVTIVGAANLPATVPFHASQAYARNIQAFLQLMVTRRGTWRVNLEDELLQNTLVACRGKIVHPQLLRIAGSSLEPETPPQSPMSGS
ncbi:MAG: hypothetical protein KatS3mg114_0565 [Planctomycetaceae bacterium]|nr:MAG: hypothetical protein KatS3mg114_0565 [Planctomycetaceae bacterium]